MQWAADLAGGALTIERVGIGECIGIDGDDRIDAILVHANAREILLHQLA